MFGSLQIGLNELTRGVMTPILECDFISLFAVLLNLLYETDDLCFNF